MLCNLIKELLICLTIFKNEIATPSGLAMTVNIKTPEKE